MVATRLEILRDEIEWRKCAQDVTYFAENYCYIRHPSKGSMLIPLRPEQREVLTMWGDGQDTISLKARQIGWSTIVCIFVMWMAMFRPESYIVLLSRKQDEARGLIEKCRFIYERFPEAFYNRVERTNRSVDSIKLSNDTIIESLPSRKDPARGKSNSLIVLDEWAFYENPEEAWASIEPTMDVGGQCIALSTANGAGNFFHKFYKSAEAGHNGFKALFYSWRVVPERDDEWYEAQKQRMRPWVLAQEYPSNPTEAFVISGSPAFDVEVLLSAVEREYTRGWLVEHSTGVQFRESHQGDLHIFKHPEASRTYVLGGDVAAGTAAGDYSCGQVIDVFTGEQVARWHGHINVDLFAEELYRLGQYYNWALLAPEVNGVGQRVVDHLHLTLEYPNLYMDRNARRNELTPGWRTTASTKLILVLGLVEAIRDRAILPTHASTISELVAFRQSRNGGFEGDPNDDEVMALGIAWQLVPHAAPSRLPSTGESGSDQGFRVSSVLKDMDRGGRPRGRIGSI